MQDLNVPRDPPPQRTITLADFLTDAEITQAGKLFKAARMLDAPSGSFAKACCDEIIKPNMPRIERALGQQMDAMYLAYAVEYAMNQALNH